MLKKKKGFRLNFTAQTLSKRKMPPVHTFSKQPSLHDSTQQTAEHSAASVVQQAGDS